MEEDIKRIEEIKKKFEKTMKIIVLGEYSTYVDNSIFEDIKKLINISENLIARYKQLEDKIIYNDIDFNGNLEQIKDMNDKEVIERLNRFKTIKVMYGNTFAMHLEQLKQLQSDIETVLNLIQTQQAEIKKKDDKLKDIKNHIKRN